MYSDAAPGKEICDMDCLFIDLYYMVSFFTLCNQILCGDLSFYLCHSDCHSIVGAFLQGQPETEACSGSVLVFDRAGGRHNRDVMSAVLYTGNNRNVSQSANTRSGDHDQSDGEFMLWGINYGGSNRIFLPDLEKTEKAFRSVPIAPGVSVCVGSGFFYTLQ